MGVRILHDSEQGYAALFCSTSDMAFGPIFGKGDAPEYKDADERAQAFLRWLENVSPARWRSFDPGIVIGSHAYDPRSLSDGGLQRAYSDWLAQESEQYQREDAAERQQWADELADD